MFFKSFLCLVDNKRTEIARVVLCENNFCTKYAHHLHFCGLQKLNTLNLRYLHPPLNPCNHFSTVLIKTNWYTISCKYYGCTSLTSVEMPLTITKIGDQAFYGCTALVRQDIPSNVTEIGSEAFCGCSQHRPHHTFRHKEHRRKGFQRLQCADHTLCAQRIANSDNLQHI